MIRFEQYCVLAEMSLEDIRANMIASINDANNKDLVTMYKAMESSIAHRTIRNKMVQLFKARGLDAFIDRPPFDEFMKRVLNTKQDLDSKISFMDRALSGSLFNSSAMIKSKGGNLKSHFDISNPVLAELLPWMLNWAPQIDNNSTVTVGSSEALMIFLGKGGAKGNPFGDVKIGSTVIEVKTSGSGLGKDGSKYWGNSKEAFANSVKKIFPSFANKSVAEISKLNPLFPTKQKEKSIALNELSLMMSAAGKTDAEISAFWKNFIDTSLGLSLPATIKVNRGVCDYDSWMRYAIAVSYEAYKKQTKFDMITLIDTNTGEYVNFGSGADMLNNSGWHYDQSLTWRGGGQGAGLSPRIMMGNKSFPTYQSRDHIKAIDKQYADIKKVADNIIRKTKKADSLVSALVVDPNIDHSVKITALIRNPELKKIMSMRTKREIVDYWNKVPKK